MDKIFKNQQYLKNLKFEGHFDLDNYDSSELKKHDDLVLNRRGEPFSKQVKIGDSTVTKKFYRYHMMLPIVHGLCRERQILPAGVHVRLTFHRASPKKALVDISDTIITYEGSSIKLMDPILQGCYAYGSKLTQQMSKISNNGQSIPFDSMHIRHRVLDTGLMEHRVEILQGPLPDYIVFFFVEPNRFSNDLKLSSTKFEMHGLEQFSLVMDNVVAESYPLKIINHGNSKFFHNFYRRWLLMTSNYGNSDEFVMDEATYINTNFMILETFEDFENREGHLAVNMKFAQLLEEKLYLCWMPCTKKMIKFDRNLNVTLT